MASSIVISFAPATVRVKATAAKGAASVAKEEKGFIDWLLGNLTKQDQFYETDPILKKVDGGDKNSVAVPPKKNGGFGGLFAKK